MIYEAQEHDLQDMGDLSPEELLVQTDVSGYVRKLVDQLPEQYRLILRFTTWMNFRTKK